MSFQVSSNFNNGGIKKKANVAPVESSQKRKLVCKMELNNVATEGLNLCGDSARVGDRGFRNLVQITMDILLKKKSEDALKSE